MILFYHYIISILSHLVSYLRKTVVKILIHSSRERSLLIPDFHRSDDEVIYRARNSKNSYENSMVGKVEVILYKKI